MRSTERNKKKEIRWDAEGAGIRWLDKQIPFTKHHRDALDKVCHEPGFIEAVQGVGDHYLSRSKPEPPKNARWCPEYRKKWVPLSQGDMKKTLLDLQKEENKVKRLAKTKRTHPIWGIFKNAWYAETKSKLNFGDYNSISQFHRLRLQLETTPDDHPDKHIIQAIWDREHKNNFEKLNDKLNRLIEVSLEHLKTVHHEPKTNSVENEKWLAWRLALILKRFGIKPTQVKDGALCLCIEIVLDATGHVSKSVHNYITSEMLKQVKNSE